MLVPDSPGNCYDEFGIVPQGLREKLRQGLVLVNNWHVLNWESDEQLEKKRSVDKRGAKSDEAYVREVLGEMARARNIIVINDEAHHAWRVPAGPKIKDVFFAKSAKIEVLAVYQADNYTLQVIVSNRGDAPAFANSASISTDAASLDFELTERILEPSRLVVLSLRAKNKIREGESRRLTLKIKQMNGKEEEWTHEF